MKNPTFSIFLSSSIFFLVSAEDVLEYIQILNTRSNVNSKKNDATYDCRLFNLWTANRHPADFPRFPHWSPPVTATHNKKYSMFNEGEDHTDGLENVAEFGDTTKILKELRKEGDNILSAVESNEFDAGTFEFSTRIKNIRIDNDHPFLSIVTMIADSPDWFSGVNNFDMRRKKKRWIEELILDLFPWDAGSDGGDTYEGPYFNTKNTVFQLTNATIPDTLVFQSPEGLTVLPVARLHCTLEGVATGSGLKRLNKRCQSTDECDTGLSCQIPSNGNQNKRRCYPLLYSTQTCEASEHCFENLECVDGVCVDI